MSDSSLSFIHPWPERLIGNIASVIVGGTPRTSVDKYWNGDIPWMVSGDVHLKSISDVSGRITELGLKYSNATTVDHPTVAIGLAGQGKTRGTVALVHCKLCTNQSVALIKGDPRQIETTYLLYNLEFRYEELRSRSAGGGRAGLSKQLIEQIPVPLAIILEQTKIGEILSKVDIAIEQTEALIAKQQRIKTGLMHDLLTRGIDERGNLRSEQTHLFKDSPLGRIPVEWEVKELSDCYGEPARNGLYKPKEFYGSGSSMAHMPQMFRGLIVDVHSSVRVQVDRSEIARFGLQTNDLLIARRSLISEGAGRCSLVPEINEPTTFESSIIRVRLKQDRLNAKFANFFLNSEAGYRMRLPFIRQVAVSGVASEDVGQFLVPLPGADEQRRIVEFLTKSETLIASMVATANKLRSQKTALMQDLLTGKKRVAPLLEPETTH
jgi:type I restriction enzyme S subunit